MRSGRQLSGANRELTLPCKLETQYPCGFNRVNRVNVGVAHTRAHMHAVCPVKNSTALKNASHVYTPHVNHVNPVKPA
jgi:hypothetical protein